MRAKNYDKCIRLSQCTTIQRMSDLSNKLDTDGDDERDMGPQPIAAVMQQHSLNATQLVAASDEQLTHKMVARAVRGRRLTRNVAGKLVRALNKATGGAYGEADLFTYKPLL